MQHATLSHSFTVKGVLSAALSALLALCLMGVGLVQPAYAEPTAAEKQAEAQEALANLNAMQETLDRLEAEHGEAVAAQAEAEENRDAAKARLDDLNAQIADLQERLGDRARDMYRSGSISYLEILLGSRSFAEFATSWSVLNKVNENDAVMVQERKDLAVEAQEQTEIYTEQARVAAEKEREASAAASQAEATVAEMQATYESLSAEAERLLEEERKAQEAAEAARAAAIVEASAAAARAEQAAASGGTAEAASVSTESASGSDATAGANTTSESFEGGSDTVSRAYACLGAPYVWGGVGPKGYDCSGLVSYCLTGSHTRLGTTYTFMKWPTATNPQPGDIAVNSGHTGVYIGDGKMIHAATYGVGVIVGPVQSGMKIVRWQG